jgi:hypothetical protein
MSEVRISVRGSWLALTATAYLVILYLRSRDSITRFPADPGYDYVLQSAESGLASLGNGDPYLHVVARSLALVTSWFPLEWHAIVLSILVHLLWVGCAIVLNRTVRIETGSNSMAFTAGLLLVACAHAAESSLGNIGNVKWPLFAASIVVSASQTTLRSHPAISVSLLLLTGLTQPLTILCLAPLLLCAFRGNQNRRVMIAVGATCIATFLVQLAKVGWDAASSGRSETISEPWTGMGLFWWSGLLGPAVIVAVVLVLSLLSRLLGGSHSEFALVIGLASVLTSVLSYAMGGIADRYFVAPTTLSILALIITLRIFPYSTSTFRVFITVGTSLALLVPTIKWFSSSNYLTSGPTWAAEVRRARAECQTDQTLRVELAVSAGSTTTLQCEYVLRD